MRILGSLPALLLSCVLSAFPAFAQEAEPAAPLSPPPLVETPREEPPPVPQGELIPRAEPDQLHLLPIRVVASTLVAPVIGSLLSIPGVLVMWFSVFNENSTFSTATFIGAGMGIAGLSAGVMLGTNAMGRLLGGSFQWLPTLLLAVAGAGVGAGIASTRIKDESDFFFNFRHLEYPFILCTLGGVVGYELFNALESSRGGTRASSGVRVMPLATLTPQGGLLAGLVGRF